MAIFFLFSHKSGSLNPISCGSSPQIASQVTGPIGLVLLIGSSRLKHRAAPNPKGRDPNFPWRPGGHRFHTAVAFSSGNPTPARRQTGRPPDVLLPRPESRDSPSPAQPDAATGNS
ncbi:hypothetical protein L484_019820 [Morus notabilis]|uniref:Uncharacterized protein n=1 Tax=Morus notabilis TaxID=981085 RepID=W9S4F9_9ROSA|nr:hypothetical protein L484_019820 [Morus notabilis]